ncbi:hypothetical protein [Lacisediminihabitans changchengi]|nr:hypothetical protein [Lacisediminihabitans changchengi]
MNGVSPAFIHTPMTDAMMEKREVLGFGGDDLTVVFKHPFSLV